MNLLRKYWKFLLIVLASAGLLVYAHSRIGPVKERATSDMTQARGQLDRLIKDVTDDAAKFGAPANVAVVELRARRNALNEMVLAQASETSFRLAGDYNIEALGKDADKEARTGFYLDRLARVEHWLGTARFWDPKITGESAQTGYDFSGTQSTGGPGLEHKLLRLDILRRIAGAAERSGVAHVTEILFLPENGLEGMEERLPSARRNVTGGPKGGLPMLRAIGVTIKARGKPMSLYAFLADIQRTADGGETGRALAVVTFDVKKADWKDPADDLAECSATLAAFSVLPDAELPEASLEVARARREPPVPGVTGTPGDAFGGDPRDVDPDRDPRRPRR